MKKIDKHIMDILRGSEGPLGPTEIAKEVAGKIGKDSIPTTTLYYHLKKLKDEEIIVSKDGKYASNDLDEIKIKIKEILSKNPEGLSLKELQKLGFKKRKIVAALRYLYVDHLVNEIKYVSTEEGAVHNYTLSPFGLSDFGLCPFCNEQLKDSDNVIVSIIAPIGLSPEYKIVKIHPRCFLKSTSFSKDFKTEGAFCEYCGLPLSPEDLPVQGIDYKSIEDHFYQIEIATIKLIEELYQSLSKDVEKEYSLLPTIAVIDLKYEQHGMKIPDWLSEKMRKCDNPNSYHKANLEISDDIERILLNHPIVPFLPGFSSLLDLSKLSSAEMFLRGLNRYRDKNEVEEAINKGYLPSDYDINSRISEIWGVAQDLKHENLRDILRGYEKLLGPAGSVYIRTIPIVESTSPFKNSQTFPQILAFKKREKLYHPYCAEKLGLKDDSHLDDKINEKEVKK
ncbi:winged helix-turn-helix transcriptional regulator [Candidatus Pacearchaeota archaeon]|nr:winged helix-turn-helix transcriptional regulator [Candidatus Pacearchaeota archaeon]